MKTVFRHQQKRTFLNAESADRPLISPLPHEVLDRARAYRLGRLRMEKERSDVSTLLLYDPINIRYALDSSNMQVFSEHNPIRYAMILPGGPAILWEIRKGAHLNKDLPLVDEVPGLELLDVHGDKVSVRLDRWADEIAELVREYGGGNMRTAIDRLDGLGVFAL